MPTSFTTPNDYSVEQGQIERKRALAQALQQQSMQDIPQQTAGGWVVRNSPLQGAARMAQAYAAKKNQEKADTQQLTMGQRYQTELARTLMQAQQAGQGAPGSPMPSPELGGGPAQPAVAPDRQAMARLLMGHPGSQQLGQQMMLHDIPKAPEAFTLKPGDVRYDPRGQPIATGPAEKPANIPQPFTLPPGGSRYDASGNLVATAPEKTPPKPKPPVGYRFSSDGETLEPLPGGPKDPKSIQLPSAALKLQQQELDAIGTAAGITQDLQAMSAQIDSGKLNLGPVNNLVNRGRNLTGLSSESSRNLGSFEATLERMRNDSLRLNKGVQTEGDAQRAWNELVKNINDPALVKQRLGEISQINERAVNLRKMNIDAIRANYGGAPMDTSGYENQGPAVGGGVPTPQRRSTDKADPLGIRKK